MAAVDSAGTKILNLLYTVNIKMWRHPKYYKELRKRNKSDQVISETKPTGDGERAPGQGLKVPSSKHQAASDKDQASSVKHQALKLSNQPG